MKEIILLSVIFISLSFLLSSCTYEIREDNFFLKHGRFSFPETRLTETTYVKNLVLQTQDNVTLTGMLAGNDSSKDYLLYFCGVGENISDDYKRICLISEKYNINVIAFDYRGYGQSKGTPTFEGLLSDALLIYDYTEKTYKPKRIFALGHSIGTTCVEMIGAKRKPSGIILEAAFTNAAEAIPGLSEAFAWPLNPLLKFKAAQAIAERRPQPEDLIKEIKVPLLILHGAKDKAFPVVMAEKMYKNSGSKNKKLVIVEDGDHFVDFDSEAVSTPLKAFLN